MLAFQECGPEGAKVLALHLGPNFEHFSARAEDPVSTFWDTRVYAQAAPGVLRKAFRSPLNQKAPSIYSHSL